MVFFPIERQIDQVNNDIFSSYQEGELPFEKQRDRVTMGIGATKDSVSVCSNPDIDIIKLQMRVHQTYASQVRTYDSETDLRNAEEIKIIQKRQKETEKKDLSLENANYWNTGLTIGTYLGLSTTAIATLVSCSNPWSLEKTRKLY
jgi:hypothetical protein